MRHDSPCGAKATIKLFVLVAEELFDFFHQHVGIGRV
jgi:hypothetical protein